MRLTVIGVDVNIYASSTRDAWPLHGNHENTEVGDFLAAYLDLNVEAVTQKLQEQATLSWLGDPLGADVRVSEFDSYHGDFRKRGEGCDCGQH